MMEPTAEARAIAALIGPMIADWIRFNFESADARKCEAFRLAVKIGREPADVGAAVVEWLARWAEEERG